MALRVGINGFGRIGRNVFRAMAATHPDLEVVAVNDLTDASHLAHLLKYDTTFGRYPGQVSASDGVITVDGRKTHVLSEKEPGALPWRDFGVEIVVESTGRFTDGSRARAHIDGGGARKVVISAPATNQDYTVVLGVNQAGYDPARHHVVSNASCTTNCLVPVIKVLDEAFGIEQGMMTTVHAYTADQMLQDGPHKDLRRARAAASNIVPTSTGANRAVAEVLPHLEGRFQGMAIRVPVIDVSVIDLNVQLNRPGDIRAVNQAFIDAAAGPLQGILGVTDEPLVSSDFKQDPRSSIVDTLATLMLGDRFAKVVSWYDNEWGYSCRVADLVAFMGERL